MEVLPLEEIKKRIGQEIALSDWVEIDQDRINKFADCTNDHQWIHVDLEKAAAGPFGKPIAHGFLSLSLIPGLQGEGGIVPEGIKMAVNYGLNKVRFINPVQVDSKVRSRAVLSNIEEKSGGRLLMTTTITLEIEGQEKPAYIAETLALFYV